MTDNFQEYNFPKFGMVRLPKVVITPEERQKYELSESATNYEFLCKLTQVGFKKFIHKINPERHAEYFARAEFELSTFNELGYVDYILLVWRVMEKTREFGGFCDAGRGSIVSSLVSGLLQITGIIDVLDKQLIFERFVSKARSKKQIIDGEVYVDGGLAPDADLNLGDVRPQVVEWLKTQFPDRICKISTFGSYTGKILIKDVYKVIEEVDEDEAKRVADLIEKNAGFVSDLSEMLEISEEFKEWSQEHKKTFDLALKLRDLPRNKSSHASGYFLSVETLDKIGPLELNKEDDLCLCFDKEDAAKLGTKLDLLGLTTNEIIREIIPNIPEKIEDIELDTNPLIYSQYQDGKLLPYGLYQISADCAYRVLSDVKPKNIFELCDVNAIARPGALAYLKDYVNNSAPPTHKAFEAILKQTRGVCLFQESIMQMAMVVGFTADEAEVLRRIIGKKKVSEVKLWKERIYEKCKQNGFETTVGDLLWEIAEANSKYGFNRCLTPDTMVIRENGFSAVQMSEIKVGDSIIGFNPDTNTKGAVKVVNIFSDKTKVYDVTFKNDYQIKASLKHKFQTRNGMFSLKDILVHSLEVLCEYGEYTTVEDFKELKKQNTLDFEVDSPHHNFYANGLLVSNSHSMATAYQSALTTYLKYKYPVQFYTACLNSTKNLPNPTEEIELIQKELHNFNIKLLPPHLLKSKMSFAAEDGNIRFGLSSVKGVSEKTVDKLLKFQRPHANKFEGFQAAKESGLNIGQISVLIQAGALDDQLTQSRAKTVLEAQTWNLLTDKEKRTCIEMGAEFKFDLLKLVKHLTDERKDEKGKPFIKASRFQTIRAKYEPYKQIYQINSQSERLCNYFYEKKTLGFAYSSRLKDIYLGAQPKLQYISDIKSAKPESRCLFIGSVIESKRAIAKNEKKTKYLKIKVADERDVIDVLVFNNKIEESYSLNGNKDPHEEDIVVIMGNKKKDAVFADLVSVQTQKIYWKLSELKDNQEKLPA